MSLHRSPFVLAALGSLFLLTSFGAAAAETRPPLRMAIDARALPRKLLDATLTLPVANSLTNSGGEIALWYPKWVPGSHGPGGPIANLAGLLIRDDRGERLSWTRQPGEVYRVVVPVRPGTKHLVVRIRYITDQPSSTSNGHDSFSSAMLGVISPSTVLMYAEGMDIDADRVAVSLRLPEEWVASTALRPRGKEQAGQVIRYRPVTLRTLADSPIMCGRYRRIYDLVEDEHRKKIPPHRLHVFSEAESVLSIHPELLQKFRQMVTQAALLFDSHPYEEFDILLATTDMLKRNGLEHAASTFNILPQRALQSPRELKGWDRLLIPHEYIHAWCGKYRRPAGMLTSDFHTPKETELLWVYEGLTQYLGEVIEARCGLMNRDEFLHRLSVEVRHALHQQGRSWRSLVDTAACSHLLRESSKSWARLRRGQDYYMEGMLFWLEADAIIRTRTNGEKSLDNFCRRFFRSPSGRKNPRGFDRAEVVADLNAVLKFDWDGLISRRVESVGQPFDPQVVEAMGYSVQYSNQRPDIPRSTFRVAAGLDELDSIGAVVSEDGLVVDLLLDSPADKAELGPGMKIIGVNGHSWSGNRLRDAIAMSATGHPIELLLVNGDSFRTRAVDYSGGPRYMVLTPRRDGPDLLSEMVKPR